MESGSSTLRKRQYFLLLASLSFLLILIGCTDEDTDNDVSSTQYSASEDFRYAVLVSSQTVFRIAAINGSAEIAGVADADSVIIWGEREVQSESLADAEAHLQYLSVVVEEREGDIRVRTDQPDDTQGRSYQVFYHVVLPESMALTVSQINGGVAVQNIHGDADIAITNGGISAAAVFGDFHLSLINGSANLDDLHGSVSASITNGAMNAEVFLPISGLCNLSLINGPIHLRIPTTTSAVFSASLIHGAVTITGLTLQDIISTPTSISGILGDGEGSIDLNTVNGSISVTGF